MSLRDIGNANLTKKSGVCHDVLDFFSPQRCQCILLERKVDLRGADKHVALMTSGV